jgi:hypothetical protein
MSATGDTELVYMYIRGNRGRCQSYTVLAWNLQHVKCSL